MHSSDLLQIFLHKSTKSDIPATGGFSLPKKLISSLFNEIYRPTTYASRQLIILVTVISV